MKKTLAVLILVMLLSNTPIYAGSRHTPLRYTNQERCLKHAGTIHHKSTIMNLNYETGAGLNYNTGAAFNYKVSTGFNYRPATNLRYR